jgi:hypothetical protein
MITSSQQIGGALGLAAIVSVAATRSMTLIAHGRRPAGAEAAGTHLAFYVATVVLAVAAVVAAARIGRFRPTTAMPLPEAPVRPVEETYDV